MHNLLIDIVTNNIPDNFIGLINRALDEKIRKQFKSRNIKYDNLELDTIKNHFFIYGKNISSQKFELENFANIINDVINSINFKYNYKTELLSFKQSIIYVKLLSEEQEKIIDFDNKDRVNNDIALNSSIINDFSTELLKNEIILKKEKRLESFKKSAHKVARANGCVIIENNEILNSYVNKYDYPICIECSFDEKYITMDKQILHTVLMENFNVLPLDFDNGNNSNIFIYARDKKSNDFINLTAEVNLKLENISFLIKNKSEKKLEDFVNDLKLIPYVNNFGNYYDKTERLINISQDLCKILSVSDETMQSVNRISFLCKADRATEIVKQYFYLHGLIGRLYAKSDGEDQIVYDGIYQHIKPRYFQENIPNSIAARIVSISDKMEYVMAYLISSNDENLKYNYKIRTTISSVIAIILKSELDFNLDDFISNILYVFLKENGIVDYENLHLKIRDIVLDVYRDNCIKLGYEYEEVDVINYENLNLLSSHQVLKEIHNLDSNKKDALINKLNKFNGIDTSNLNYTPMEVDINCLQSVLDKFLDCSEDDIKFYKVIFKKIFNNGK